ncbi:MAG: hypothetical protein HKN33_13510 [Pyrinomonadaceae bacterium]|nr:hypothetical protein [Pyrinomonadaceae bacterium]
MNCEELQLDIPLYADDVLSDSERAAVEDHLPTCPLCRQALSEYVSLRLEVGQLSANALPADLAVSIKSQISEKLNTRPVITVATREDSVREKLMHWLMPYSIGTVAASLFMIAFLFVLMSELQSSVNVLEARSMSDAPVLLVNANTADMRDSMELPPEFGNVPIATSPPELNPAGALVALTKSIVRGKMQDEEVVIVADVFGNGLARIAGVVDPPDNDRSMEELQRAFETDPAKAPFKASKTNPEAPAVRVVLKIQRVDVDNLR